MLNDLNTGHTTPTPLLSPRRSPSVVTTLTLILNDDADGYRITKPLAEHKLEGRGTGKAVLVDCREATALVYICLRFLCSSGIKP